jgi:hypothetical protein
MKVALLWRTGQVVECVTLMKMMAMSKIQTSKKTGLQTGTLT